MGVRATQLTVAHLLGLPLSHVRVIAPFVGGSFGMKAMVWPSVTLTAMAARHVGRPVKLMLTRPQMFTSNGHREEQEQRIALGATRDGRLTAIEHEKLSITSPFDDWAEPATGVSSQLYACRNFRGVHRLVRGNTMTPTFTRGPGESLGVSMLEIAMDELAYELGIDPVELRLRNHTPVDARGNAWSSDGLPECLRRGAEVFGWSQREPTPRATRDGDWLIGTGMAAVGISGGVLHAGAARAGARARRRQRRRPDRHAGVRHGRPHDGDPGRGRRPRRRARGDDVPGRRLRPPEQHGGGRLRRRGDGGLRGARGRRLRSASSSSSWRSATRDRRCTASARAP